MARKLTWRMIYTDFCKHYPTLKKKVVSWRPHDYATIYLTCEDGIRMIYNYDSKKADFVK